MLKHTLIGAALAALLATPALAQTSTFSGWTPLGDVQTRPGSASLSTGVAGEDAVYGGSAVDFTELQRQLGVALPGDTVEGSAVVIHVDAAALSTVSAQLGFATVGFDAGFADRAYAIVDGQVVPLFEAQGDALQSSRFAYTFASAGPHTLGFAVLDVNDSSGLSTLSVSGLSVSAVPEPASSTLLLVGLGALGAGARRQRRGG